MTICPAETQHFGQGLRLGSLKLAIYSSNLMQSTGILRPKIWPDEFTIICGFIHVQSLMEHLKLLEDKKKKYPVL